MKQLRLYIAFVFAAAFLLGCGDSGCNVIPNVTVHSPFSQGSHPTVFAAFGSAYVSGGVSGLIVYNKGDGFVAFDRCSPVNPDQRNAIEVLGANVAFDPVSGAKWDLNSGFPMAIAECPLKPYHVGIFGDNSYKISN